MEKRRYTQAQKPLPEVEAMLSAGKTLREVAEEFGFLDKYVVKNHLSGSEGSSANWRRGSHRAQGQTTRGAQPIDIAAEQAYEIQRLQMENKLLRDFLQSAGRT